MKQLFIHIGLHKTGTTAIQRFLRSNGKALDEEGFLYPGTRPAHHVIRWLWEEYPHTSRDLSGNARALFREIRTSEKNRIILSSEMLTGGRENVAIPLAKVLDEEIGGEWTAKIIIYLRRQDRWLESRYVENIKNSFLLLPRRLKILTFTEFLSQYRNYYEIDYYLKLQPWSEMFGRENIIVRPYEKPQLRGTITADFLYAVGITGQEKFSEPAQTFPNRGMSADAIELIRMYNKYLNAGPRLRNILCDKVFSRISAKTPFSPYSYFSSHDRYALLAEYEESNRRVAMDYLGRSDGRLFIEELPDPLKTDDGYRGIELRKVLGIGGFRVSR